MMQKRLRATCSRDKFKWVRVREDYEGRMAGHKWQEGPGQDDSLKSSCVRLDFTQQIIGNFQRILSRGMAC